MNPKAEFIQGDVTRRSYLEKALAGIDAAFHETAKVEVGQSMYEIKKYTKNTVLGTALFFDLIVNQYRNKIKKIIVAASMSSYGEGKYQKKYKAPNSLQSTQKRCKTLLCGY